MSSGLVFNIQKYVLHDGPGIRSTVFLKGCPLCCAWCHNPESLSPRREIIVAENRCIACGECRTACPFADLVPGTGPLPARIDPCIQCGACLEACPTGARQMVGRTMVSRDRIFYEESNGGVTISGGEPLAQAAFTTDLIYALHTAGLHVALDTTGFGRTEHLLRAAKFADLVLYDLKAFDGARHRQLTGVPNQTILDNLRALDNVHPNLWIRLPVVPGFTDDLGELRRLAELVRALQHVTLVNLLPFHRSGLHKYARLGWTHQLGDVEAPSAGVMERAADLFRTAGLPTKVGG
jgi:pyruvate formate lyase activating enzyme